METAVIFWDEFPGNHRSLFEAVIQFFRQDAYMHKKFVFVCIGDFSQIGPVVKDGLDEDTIGATISSSLLWENFTILKLTENMRLSALHRALPPNAQPADVDDLDKQIRYAKSLINISKNTEGRDCIIVEVIDQYKSMIALPLIEYFLDTDKDNALLWLYDVPDFTDYKTIMSKSSVVLTGTNDSVDSWNSKIQSFNPNPLIVLTAKDKFADVDDEHGYLAKTITEETMSTFDKTGVPPHQLQLKVDDICLILRTVAELDLPTNSRVIILEIHNHVIKAQTLDFFPARIVHITRIHFRFRLQYGQSFQLLRTQFPLRLAYSMTYNKAQGQTLQRTLVDFTNPPFTHGHAYCATSRVRNLNDIRFFVTENNLHTELLPGHEHPTTMPMFINTVYTDVLI